MEAGLQVDQQGKTSRCHIHTSATGCLCAGDEMAKVSSRPSLADTGSLYPPAELRVCKHSMHTHTHTDTHTQARACISLSIPPHLTRTAFNVSNVKICSSGIPQPLIVFSQ